VKGRKILSSPMSPHMMTHLRDIPDDDKDESDGVNSSDEEGLNKEQVEYAKEEESVEVEVEVTDNPTISAANIIIPELDLTMFITENFCYNLCLAPVGVRNLKLVIVGCASNLFWKCSSTTCDASAKILAKQSSKEVSGTTRRYHRSKLQARLVSNTTGTTSSIVANGARLKSGQKRRKFRSKANSETRSKTRENMSSS
jgi:hypothetical protein